MRNLVFIEKYDKYGIILKSRKVTTKDGEEKVIRRINFDNDFELLKKPELLLQKSYYNDNYDPLTFRIATEFDNGIAYYGFYRDTETFETEEQAEYDYNYNFEFFEFKNYEEALKLAKRVKRREKLGVIYIAAIADVNIGNNLELYIV